MLFIKEHSGGRTSQLADLSSLPTAVTAWMESYPLYHQETPLKSIY